MYFDMKINEKDPKKLIQIIQISRTYFLVECNLEDIKAPEVWNRTALKKKEMKIPVCMIDASMVPPPANYAQELLCSTSLEIVRKDNLK